MGVSMSPLEPPPKRYFVVELARDNVSLKTMPIRGQTACEPKESSDKWLVFKKGRAVVSKARVHKQAGWHVGEVNRQ